MILIFIFYKIHLDFALHYFLVGIKIILNLTQNVNGDVFSCIVFEFNSFIFFSFFNHLFDINFKTNINMSFYCLCSTKELKSVTTNIYYHDVIFDCT